MSVISTAAAECEPRNPGGNMGIGSVIMDAEGTVLHEVSEMLPANAKNSNNVAEYLSFTSILDWFKANKVENSAISIKGDSMMVTQQMNKAWKIKQGLYTPYARAADQLLFELRKGAGNQFTIQWIPREHNEHCDNLSKAHLPELKDWKSNRIIVNP